MRSKRPAYLLATLAVGFLGIYWAAGSAQERPPLFAPPPVLPIEPPEPAKAPPAKAPTKHSGSPTSKPADPNLIIPAAAYEEPRPIKPKDVAAPIVPLPLPTEVGSGAPAPGPTFPPLPAIPNQLDVKLPDVLPPLPAPLPEPTKTLIAEPAPKSAPVPVEVPKALPLMIPAPAEPFGKDTLKVIESPAAPRQVIQAPAVLVAPPIDAPDVKPPIVVAPVQPINEKPRGFVRIRTETSVPSPAAMAVPAMPAALPEVRTIEPLAPLSPPLPPLAGAPIAKLPAPAVGDPALIASSVQTPAVTVEKHGPIAPRTGDTVSYQIVVRNQGNMPAQQIRIEDEIAPDARFINADPMPIMTANKVVWTLTALPANQVQVLRLTLQAGSPGPGHRTTVQVAATSPVTTTNVQRPANPATGIGMELIAPRQLALGKEAIFQFRVVNHTAQPLSGLVLHAALPPGLSSPAGRDLEGPVDGVLQPGEAKTLRMPTKVVQVGHFTLEAKVTTQTGQEASASAAIDIGTESLQVQQPANTRIFVGRDGDLRIEVTNATSRPLRHVAVSNRLPDGLDFVIASERGLYQANSRTVHWLIDSLPAGASQTLRLRLYGIKPGAYQNVVVAKADGGVQATCMGSMVVQAVADLSLRVIDKDRVLEVGRETSYEIQLENPSHALATNLRLRVEFPPSMVPKNVQGNTPHTQDRQTIVFEPIASLSPHDKMVFRVSAVAQTTGDQRVRFAVVSDQVPTPIVREISTLAYRD